MKYSEYINEFSYLKNSFDTSFIIYKYDETEEDKEDIIRYFSNHFPEYKFKSSLERTAFFFEKKHLKNNP